MKEDGDGKNHDGRGHGWRGIGGYTVLVIIAPLRVITARPVIIRPIHARGPSLFFRPALPNDLVTFNSPFGWGGTVTGPGIETVRDGMTGRAIDHYATASLTISLKNSNEQNISERPASSRILIQFFEGVFWLQVSSAEYGAKLGYYNWRNRARTLAIFRNNSPKWPYHIDVWPTFETVKPSNPIPWESTLFNSVSFLNKIADKCHLCDKSSTRNDPFREISLALDTDLQVR